MREQRQFYLLLITVLLGFIGNSIAYPIFAPLFLNPKYNDMWLNITGYHWLSVWFGITLMMYPLGQFIGSPILGSLSDLYGRKTILVISTGLTALMYLLTAFSLSKHLLGILIFSRLFTGCFEGNISIARSIVVDNKEWDNHKSLGWIS